MAAKGRGKGTTVAEILFREPFRFQFVQAVKVLSALERERAAAGGRPPAKPVGGDSHPGEEMARFRAHQSQNFPASDVVDLRDDGDTDGNMRAPPTMSVAFMGLTGPAGVLPDHYSHLLAARLRERDPSMRDFFDLFNHRTISLFYRAAVKYHFPTGYEIARYTGQQDAFTAALYALAGFGTGGLRGRLAVDDESLAHFAGHFSHYPRSASALESMLGGYFGVPVRVEQFQGQWLYLAPDQQTRLGGSEDPEAGFNRLGVDSIAGERVWDLQGKFRIVFGPLAMAEFIRFLPNGDFFTPLAQLTKAYAGLELSAEMQLILRADDVPRLEMSDAAASPPMLGWNTWLAGDPFAADSEDVVISLDVAATA